ncbi:MAG TPA: winged helix-turn-helix domain-containing protein, partial [Vicinamibacterales bacterium]|nr:winged helix-turn-helix domain-containing protein [Vicinamibacterales bacterium]
MPRYRFSDFILSPRRRMLLRGGREQPLIPRYFDLLLFLIEHRNDAVHRRDIFDRVWDDVVVSDSALSQAIRTIRRTLGDDPREPRFIRTVSRHGYRFVFAEVFEEDDDGVWPPAEARTAAVDATSNAGADPFEPLLERITAVPTSASGEEEQREAAELLHALGTVGALARLGTRPRHAFARALLRDTRWDSALAGPVPFRGQPGAVAAAAALVGLRLRRAARVAAARWAGASIGGGLAGAGAGAVGGVLLAAAPGSAAPLAVAAVLGVIGAFAGAIGGAGAGAGLSVAEAIARSWRMPALVCGGALGGGLAGSPVQWLGRWSLAALLGVHVEIGGGLEGLVIGGAAGLGYGAATSRTQGGPAAPRGARRLGVALITAAACGLGALALTLSGRPLVGGTVHAIAQASQGAQAALTPLGRFIGEPDFGPISRAVIGTGEGAL